MKHLNFAGLKDIGINVLTGEACAFSMRILCDLSDEGALLMSDYLGLPVHRADQRIFHENYNQFVGPVPAIASIMIERDMFSKIMVFYLFRRGFRYVMGTEGGTEFTGYNADDLEKNPGLNMYHDEIREGASNRPNARVWVNPKATSTAPSVGSRNVHQFTGRVE